MMCTWGSGSEQLLPSGEEVDVEEDADEISQVGEDDTAHGCEGDDNTGSNDVQAEGATEMVGTPKPDMATSTAGEASAESTFQPKKPAATRADG